MGGALVALVVLVILLLVWKPKDNFVLQGDHAAQTAPKRHTASEVFRAWSPYMILVLMVVLSSALKALLGKVSIVFPWPGLHLAVTEVAPVVPKRPLTRPFTGSIGWGRRARPAVLAAALSSLVLGFRRPGLASFSGPPEAGFLLRNHHRRGSRAGVRDELLRGHRHSGSGIRHHRRAVSFLQRRAGRAGRVPDGIDHLRQRAVRQSPGGDGHPPAA